MQPRRKVDTQSNYSIFSPVHESRPQQYPDERHYRYDQTRGRRGRNRHREVSGWVKHEVGHRALATSLLPASRWANAVPEGPLIVAQQFTAGKTSDFKELESRRDD